MILAGLIGLHGKLSSILLVDDLVEIVNSWSSYGVHLNKLDSRRYFTCLVLLNDMYIRRSLDKIPECIEIITYFIGVLE